MTSLTKGLELYELYEPIKQNNNNQPISEYLVLSDSNVQEYF